MRISIAAAACVIVLMPWAAGLRAGAAVSVRLVASEFAFTPKDAMSTAGDVTVVVHNGGAIEHNFVLEDRSKRKLAEIPVIEPSQTIEIRASLPAGGYVIYCSLPGHRDAGMAGTLAVR